LSIYVVLTFQVLPRREGPGDGCSYHRGHHCGDHRRDHRRDHRGDHRRDHRRDV